MKRINALFLAGLLLLSMTSLSGCKEGAADTESLSVVCTIFPQYDWVCQILGDRAENMELTLLLDNKVDLHSYQPSVADIAKVSSCDLFIYVGGESDAWAQDALETATNADMIVINLLEVLGASAKEEEIREGMEHTHEDEHEDEHEEGHEDAHQHTGALDEHVWLSLKNAQIFTAAIAEALSALDAVHGEAYSRNQTAYAEKLAALDNEYQSAVDAASVKTLLFGDRFPFRYFVDDYGLEYYAAFSGCSAETEAGFETIVFLSEKADVLGLESIVVTESADQSIAKTIRDNTTGQNQQIHVLDSMQSVSGEDITTGTTYLSVMESNLNVLKAVLG